MAAFWVWHGLRAAAVAMAVASSAHARVAEECAPSDWFCDDESPPAPPLQLAPAPPEQPDEDDPSGPAAPPPAGMLPGRMDVTAPPPDAPEQEGPAERPASRWSVSLRLQGVTLGSTDNDAAMGGVGASLRFALHPHVVLDLGFDSLGGTDYNGHDRSESSLATSVLVYFNPDEAIRTYALAGLNASVARVDVFGDQQDWAYVGAHAGLGLDFPVHERVSLAIDLVGFLRGRTDSRAAREPEFTDGLGNSSNTSGGGLVRGSVVLYW